MTLSQKTLTSELQIVDVALLPQTYRWWKRIICWFLWSFPLKYFTRLFGRNPYCKIVALCNVKLPPEIIHMNLIGGDKDNADSNTIRNDGEGL